MRILIIHTTYQLRGGEDAVVEAEAELLRSAGVAVDVLLFSNEGGTVGKLLKLPFNRQAYRQTKAAIAAFRPDAVHVHNLHFAASPSVVYGVKKMKVPLVCTLHNYRLLCPSATLFHGGRLFLSSLHQTFPWTAVRKGVYRESRLLTLWLALSAQVHRWAGTWRKVDRFVALTANAQELFLRSGLNLHPGQVTVKPNFSTPGPASAQGRGEDFLFVGRLSEEKGVRVLLNAFQLSPHRLLIAGDGPLASEVKEAAEKHANIVHLGLLNREALAAQLASATALVFPSIWYEGMPLTLIEAFAAATPVIASKIGASAEMVTDGLNGLHFAPGDALSLREAVDRWAALPLSEKELHGRRANDAYQSLYSPEANLRQMLELYRSLLNRPAEPAFKKPQEMESASAAL